jgi:hypothetical protein
MSAEAAAAIRPRTTGEILDDAWRLTIADAPFLLLLNGLFLVPACTVLLLLLGLPAPKTLALQFILPAAAVVLLPLTGLGSGACQEWFRVRADGKAPRLLACLTAAFRRSLEHAAARAVLLVLPVLMLGLLPTAAQWEQSFNWSFAGTLANLIVLGTPALLLWTGGVTIHAFLASGKGRSAADLAEFMRLARFDAGKVGLATVSRLPLLVMAFLNVLLLLGGALWVVDTMAGFDMAFVGAQMTTDNPTYVAAVFLLTWMLLAPFFEACNFLLHTDARTRVEGLDLQFRVQRLFATVERRRVGALLLLAGAFFLTAGAARAAEPDAAKPPTREEVRKLLEQGGERPVVNVRPEDEQPKPKKEPKKTEDKHDDQDDADHGHGGPAVMGPPGGGCGPAFLWAMGGVGLAVLVGALAFFFATRPKRLQAPKTPAVPAKVVRTMEAPAAREYERPAAELWREADNLARDGQFLQAARSLYLAVLSLLHRRRFLRCEPTRTNGEYVQQLRLAPEAPSDLHAPFEEFTGLFERKWYGDRACEPEEYRACRALAEEIQRLVKQA